MALTCKRIRRYDRNGKTWDGNKVNHFDRSVRMLNARGPICGSGPIDQSDSLYYWPTFYHFCRSGLPNHTWRATSSRVQEYSALLARGAGRVNLRLPPYLVEFTTAGVKRWVKR
eukprot:1179351-Prorocentrum_minimum.AAC.1